MAEQGPEKKRSRREEEEEEEEDQGDDGEEEEEVDRKQILDEYKIWKKNCPYLYDLVVTHALEWPSLSVQWLERVSKVEGKDYSEQELLLGTHTSGGAQNHLMIAKVRLPNEDTDLDARLYDDERGELGRYGGTSSKVEIKLRINHDGEVNRARYMPQDDYVIASKTVAGPVDVFFIREHESTPAKDAPAEPNVRCTGHQVEGYGLDWSRLEKGLLVSSSDDGSVCVWDIKKGGRGLEPLVGLIAHEGSAGDVQWHKKHSDLFGSVGDDKKVCIFDVRDLKGTVGGRRALANPKMSAVAHGKESQALAFSPHSDYLFVTGGNDNVVKLWDMRDLSSSLHSFHGHQGDIMKVEWSPFSEAVLASCSADRRVLVWDLGRIGQEQTAEDAEDGPPELLFIHGGHTSKVSDFSWNQNDPWVLASVSEDNVLQVWQMAENIYAEEADAAETAEKIADKDLE